MMNSANPVRRVVNMLESMQKKIEEEANRDETLYEQFMCYCKKGGGDLRKSIDDAQNRIPQLESGVEEATATKSQLQADIKQHTQDAKDARESLAKARSVREKEEEAYASESAESKTNIAALGKALAAMSKGAGGAAFVQSAAANVIRQLTVDMDLTGSDRDTLSAFLSTDQQDGYAPQSGEVTGILKQMKEQMEKALAEMNKDEESAQASYDSIVSAKEKEVKASNAAIEDKQERVGDLGIKIVRMKEDLSETQHSYEEDTKFLKDMDKNCKRKVAEWNHVKKMRAEEQVAIADTIKILNDDDALELFKKTLPSPSFLQIKVTAKAMKKEAMQVLRSSRGRRVLRDMRIDLISLALRGKKASFDKIIKMIDDMVRLLSKEQKDDDSKKTYCQGELDKSEDEVKELSLQLSDKTKEIEDATGTLESLTEEIQVLELAVKELDKQVTDATKTRKAEHHEFKETLADNNAAKELLQIAKNRLMKFYDPKLYKEAPKQAMSDDEEIYVNMGGEITTPAPGGIAGTGVTSEIQEDNPSFVQVKSKTQGRPPRAPEAPGAFKEKGEESKGVIEMVDMLILDIDNQRAEMQTEEKDSQGEYEVFIKDSSEKRISDLKSVAEKEDAKADLEAQVQKLHLEKKSKTSELKASTEYLQDLHKQCDWLLKNYDVRKEARSDEIDSLQKATAVLSGADYSFLQVGRERTRVNRSLHS